MHPPALNASAFVQQLTEKLGVQRILTGTAVIPYATDVYRSREQPIAVVRPESIAELQRAIKTATEAGVAVVVRGGGASYTDGYLPSRSESMLIDMSALSRIVEINEADGYVTVEAGITWAALKTALDERGLRTPFFGPFSGIAASVGGSMSQHAISHGSGAYGTSAQSVISMDIVTASGSLIRTGAAARGGAPFLRWYGPDMLGLFTGDCGALGVKAHVTLELLRRKPAFACASYGFAGLEALASALRSAALEGLDDEHFALDATMSRGQISRQARISKVTTGKALVKAAPTPFAALKQLIRSGLAGTRQLNNAAYTAHFTLEGIEAADARIKARRLRKLMTDAGGWEIANTVPTIVRGTPFAPLFNTLGPNGERWTPLHGYLPHSRIPDFHRAVNEFMAVRASDMKRLGVFYAGMFMTVGSTGFLYELALYWPGAPSPYHQLVLPKEYLQQLPQTAHNEDVAAYVDQLKKDLVALYTKFDAAQFQLGKIYPYAEVLEADALSLVRAIKQSLDPQGLMNPGALGL